MILSIGTELSGQTVDPDQTALEYKNLSWLWGADWKFHQEGNCLASMANSYPEWLNFQFTSNSHYGFFFLHTLPSTTTFRFKCVLFCQFWLGFYLRFWHCDVWRKMTSKSYVLMSKLASWCHYWCCDIKTMSDIMHNPHVRQHFLARVGFTKFWSGMQEKAVWSGSFIRVFWMQYCTVNPNSSKF